jgi:hypothetical protein
VRLQHVQAPGAGAGELHFGLFDDPDVVVALRRVDVEAAAHATITTVTNDLASINRQVWTFVDMAHLHV